MYSRRRRWTLDADVLEGFDIGQRAAVEDGQFQVVELDDDVVDAGADEGGERCSVVEMRTPWRMRLVA